MREKPIHNSTEVLLLDDEDYILLLDTVIYLHTYGYALCKQNGKTVYVHRLLCSGAPYVDHRNRNKLDCQKKNLRSCTQRQNLQNMRSRGGTSKYKGVSWSKAKRKWVAQIRDSEGVKRFLGYFREEVVAFQAWQQAARLYHGEYYCDDQ